jgi:hypothetical protein
MKNKNPGRPPGFFLLDGFIQICHHPEVRNILGERVQLKLFTQTRESRFIHWKSVRQNQIDFHCFHENDLEYGLKKNHPLSARFSMVTRSLFVGNSSFIRVPCSGLLAM